MFEYELPGTNQTMRVISWRYKKNKVVGQSVDIEGQRVIIKKKGSNRRLDAAGRSLQGSQNDNDDENGAGYVSVTNKKVGFSIKYYGKDHYSVEINPFLNFKWFIHNNVQENRRLQEASQGSAESEGYQDQGDMEEYVDGFHTRFAETMGVDKNSTDVAHEAAYKGHEENGEFQIEEESEENKRLL